MIKSFEKLIAIINDFGEEAHTEFTIIKGAAPQSITLLVDDQTNKAVIQFVFMMKMEKKAYTTRLILLKN